MDKLGAFIAGCFLCWSGVVCGAELPTADVNSYRSLYDEPVLGAGDTCLAGRTCHQRPAPTGSPVCSGNSGVGGAADEYIIRPGTVSTAWDQINSGTYTKFFVCPGDYSGAGTITLNTSGSSGTKRWITWWTDSGYSDTLHPYDMSGAQRAILDRLYFQENTTTDYWIVDRITFEPSVTGALNLDTSTHYVILNAVYVDGTNMGSTAGLIRIVNSTDILVQNSFSGNCPAFQASDVDPLVTNNVSRLKLVNNEFKDCTHLQLKGLNSGGTIVENNDIYKSDAIRMDCDIAPTYSGGLWTKNNQDNNGKCVCSESLMATKQMGGLEGNPSLILHNRFWGARPGDMFNSGCGGGRGSVYTHQYTDNVQYVNFRENIVDEYSVGISFSSSGHNYNTIENNLFANRQYVRASDVSFPIDINDGETLGIKMAGNASNNLVQFNTFAGSYGSNVDDTDCPVDDIGQCGWIRNSSQNNYVACNVMVDAGSANTTTGLSGDYNVFVGDTERATSGGNNEPPTGTYSVAAANLTDFTYYRKLITGAEQITINNAVPTDNSPFLTNCGDYTPPAGYGAD